MPPPPRMKRRRSRLYAAGRASTFMGLHSNRPRLSLALVEHRQCPRLYLAAAHEVGWSIRNRLERPSIPFGSPALPCIQSLAAASLALRAGLSATTPFSGPCATTQRVLPLDPFPTGHRPLEALLRHHRWTGHLVSKPVPPAVGVRPENPFNEATMLRRIEPLTYHAASCSSCPLNKLVNSCSTTSAYIRYGCDSA